MGRFFREYAMNCHEKQLEFWTVFAWFPVHACLLEFFSWKAMNMILKRCLWSESMILCELPWYLLSFVLFCTCYNMILAKCLVLKFWVDIWVVGAVPRLPWSKGKEGKLFLKTIEPWEFRCQFPVLDSGLQSPFLPVYGHQMKKWLKWKL